AQDASLVAVIVLANGHQGGGAVVLYNYAWQMFFVPYAVLAVPIAVSAFPLLSAADGEEFDRTAASATRAAMLVSWLGAALLAGGGLAGRPAVRYAPAAGPPAGAALRCLRPRAGGLRARRRAVAGAVRQWPQPGGRDIAGRRLGGGDRRERRGGAAGAHPLGGADAGPGRHARPDPHP